MTSPPVSLYRVCAVGLGRMRFIRARTIPVGFLVLAASFCLSGFFVFVAPRCGHAQFPIRQVPGRAARPAPEAPPSRAPASQPQAAATPPLPAVARVVVPEKDGVSYGSGTLIDTRGQFGLVVSNWHVVRDATGPISVEFPDGFRSPAQVVKTDKDWDLAALSIYRPKSPPIPVTATAPQPGERLTIGGYGSGQWRMAAGQCTQYLAPGVEFPHEMVELAAEARQGDSGGPILNDRGELAGVLFGSGPGYTSGSYGGRVLQFLATVVPGGKPGSDAAAPETGTLAANNFSPPPSQPLAPQATALHETQPPAASPPPPTYAATPPSPPPVAANATDRLAAAPPSDTAPLTPVQPPAESALLAPPGRREVDERFGPRPLATVASEIDERVAVAPNRLASGAPGFSTPLPDASAGPVHTSLAPRAGTSTTTDLNQANSQQLLVAMWRQFGGTTIYDQTRSVLALIGILAVVVVVWRMGGEKEQPHEE